MTITVEARDSIKREHADKLVLMRVGDFYELFREDAEIAAKCLELTLCRMAKRGAGSEIAMCGFPHNQLEEHLARLVACGHRVAVGVQAS